jgi:decaprenylphospho-beta-D-ribofuranose 2-oxidase
VLRDHGEGPVIARGLGRSYGDPAMNAGGAVCGMTGVDGILALDLEAATVTVAAGTSLDTLIRRLLPFGLFVPVTPGTRFVTVGGAIAADIHGKNHHTDGSLQRHVVAFELLSPSGEQVTVTPESDPGLFAATAGGMGLTGVVVAATLRLVRVESGYMRVDTDRVPNLEAAMELMLATDDRYRYSVAWTDCLARGRSLGRSVLLRANHAAADELAQKQRREPVKLREGIHVGTPPWMPGGLLRRSTLKAFNEVFFRHYPVEERGRIEAIAPYFHPLDGIRNWNRGYGSRGFVQYQFVMPHGEERALRQVLETLSGRGCPSFLAVLKRFGAGCGMLSFPIPGWTLALDIPASFGGLDELLDGLDALVATAGGRIYLAKDARARPELLREMYPDLPRWQEIQARADPGGVLQSDMSRRLQLTLPRGKR